MFISISFIGVPVQRFIVISPCQTGDFSALTAKVNNQTGMEVSKVTFFLTNHRVPAIEQQLSTCRQTQTVGKPQSAQTFLFSLLNSLILRTTLLNMVILFVYIIWPELHYHNGFLCRDSTLKLDKGWSFLPAGDIETWAVFHTVAPLSVTPLNPAGLNQSQREACGNRKL